MGKVTDSFFAFSQVAPQPVPFYHLAALRCIHPCKLPLQCQQNWRWERGSLNWIMT